MVGGAEDRTCLTNSSRISNIACRKDRLHLISGHLLAEVHIPLSSYKGSLPRALFLSFRKLRVEIPSCLSADVHVHRRAILLPFIGIVKTADISNPYSSRRHIHRGTHLYPFSLFKIEATWIMCALADFPIPRFSKTGIGIVFRIFPVYMNVFNELLGSSAKPVMAS